MSTTTGTIVRVRRDPAGDGLAADAAIGATTLVLGWAIDFDPEGGTLQVGAEVIAYTAVDDDTDTVTLAAAMTVAYEAGEPVLALDETGTQAETWIIDVDLDDGGQPAPAVPDHSLLSMLAEGDEMVGFQAVVESDLDGNRVVSISNKAPAVESDLSVARGGSVAALTDDGLAYAFFGPWVANTGDTVSGARVLRASGDALFQAGSILSDPATLSIVQVGSFSESDTVKPYFSVFANLVDTYAVQGFNFNAGPTTAPSNPRMSIDPTNAFIFNTASIHKVVITDDSGNAGLGFTANAANVNISTVDGEVCRVTSSRRYKQNIKPARIDVQAVLALQPKQFRTKAEVKKLGKDAPVHVGVIAEEAADLGLDAWVEHDEDGPEAFAYANFSVALLAVVQDQQKQIDALKAAVERLSGDR